MKISIIIPSYKPQNYLWECLDSIYNQTLDKSEFEVILILNGCSEPWQTEILDWKEKHQDLNLIFIQTDTPGVSNARNIGIRSSKGEFITFIDDDDYISQTYLKGLLNSTLYNEMATIISNTISFNDKSRILNANYSLREIYYKLRNIGSSISLFKSRSFFNGPCMKLFPKCIIKGYFFDTRFKNGEDALYMYLISKNFQEIILAPDNCVYYRRIRNESAYNAKKNLSSVIINQIQFILAILKIYVTNPTKYKLTFTISRILAAIKTIAIQLKMNSEQTQKAHRGN